jgi:hypothetical protein
MRNGRVAISDQFSLVNCTVEGVPAKGIEPSHPCGYWILSPARLPVPPRRRRKREVTKPDVKLKRLRRDREAVNFVAARKFREE